MNTETCPVCQTPLTQQYGNSDQAHVAQQVCPTCHKVIIQHEGEMYAK